MTANLPNSSSVPKSMMMYGADGTGGLASSTNQLVCNVYIVNLCHLQIGWVIWMLKSP